MNISKLKYWPACAAVVAGLLGGCSTVDVSSSGPGFSAGDGLAVLPIVNYTETPDAGQRARSIAQSILYQKGFTQLQAYPQEDATDLLMSGGPDRVQRQALEWARNNGSRYALTGAVQEWRYKVGLDGEPVVGLTLNVVDLSNASVVWSATGSRSGWSRSSLAGVGQELIKEMLGPLSAR
jgi:TolB-like protein